jgi:hypothetical protein
VVGELGKEIAMVSLTVVSGLTERIKARIGRPAEHGSILIVRQAVRNQQAIEMVSVATALDDVIANELWGEIISPTGAAFDSLASFVLTAPPHGVGVSDQSSARMLRQALFEHKHFREWTDIMKVAARRPGNPGNHVNYEGSRFYTVDRGSRSRDKLLLLLEAQSPRHFTSVCNGECSPHRAAIEAGLIPPRPKAHTSFESILRTALGMKGKTQGKLLKRLFKELPLDAQCTLIADCIQPKLDMLGLATRWRDASGAPSTSLAPR